MAILAIYLTKLSKLKKVSTWRYLTQQYSQFNKASIAIKQADTAVSNEVNVLLIAHRQEYL